MSRIGKYPVALPQGVEARIGEGELTVKGAKGSLSMAVLDDVEVSRDEAGLRVTPRGEGKRARAMWGLHRSLIANMVEGVSQGFRKDLEIVGVGYRCEVSGHKLTLNVGYSHPVEMEIPEGLEVTAEGPTRLTVRGIDKQRVGQLAAEIRRVRPPEPYKGKGIRYADEHVRRKVGKSGVGG